MGIDIYGWVETREMIDESWGFEGWDAAIRINNIVSASRNYAMYAGLFGVRNGGRGEATAFGRFRAIAPARGAPPEPSRWYEEERQKKGGGAVGETWVLWSELAAIDWDEEGIYYLGDGKVQAAHGGPSEPSWPHERRGDWLNGGWPTLFKLMAALADLFGADNVRLSVWFDSW
jgi:hypothetical protein